MGCNCFKRKKDGLDSLPTARPVTPKINQSSTSTKPAVTGVQSSLASLPPNRKFSPGPISTSVPLAGTVAQSASSTTSPPSRKSSPTRIPPAGTKSSENAGLTTISPPRRSSPNLTSVPQTNTVAQSSISLPPPPRRKHSPNSPSIPLPETTVPAADPTVVAQVVTRTPWEQAIDRLKPEDREGINFNSQDETEINILKLFVQEAERKKIECEDKQWRYKNSNGEEILLRDRMNSLLLNLQQYTSIGDLVIQPLPSVVSLAWGGFKVLLQIAITDMENTAIAMESLNSLARILAHCAIYEKLYSQQGLDASQSRDGTLIDLYVLILGYLCYLKRHLTHNTAVQGLKNILSGLKTRWEELLAMEIEVDKEARIAHQEATQKSLYACNSQMVAMVALLKDTNALREPIREVHNKVADIKCTVENIFKSISGDLRLKILLWLSDLSPERHHEYTKSFRSPGTGEWLLEKGNFRDWKYSESSALLWLHGIAGSGKTILASKIIDEVEPETKNLEYSLAYFYCNYKEAERRDPASILRSIVKQLCVQRPGDFPEPVSQIYEQRTKKGDTSPLTVDESKDLLIALSAGFLRTTIVIDALDECDRDTRGKLFTVLEQVVSSSKKNPVKVFVTSRDDADLRRKFEDSPNVYIQERDNSGDINHYIKTEVEACIEKKELLDGKVGLILQEHIITTLQEGARGMFLWVKHQIARICKEITEDGVKQALAEPPGDLNSIYLEILQRIKMHQSPRTSSMTENVLKWILYAVRPLSPPELLEAISSGLTLPVLLDICQNLVVLDQRLGVLRFSHFSVQEFLLAQFKAEEAHAFVGKFCLILLINQTTPEPNALAMTDYAIFNWPEHVRLSGNALTNLCVSFLKPCPAYNAWILGVSEKHRELRPLASRTLSPLLITCYYQLLDVLKKLLSTQSDLNCRNHAGRTPCHFAASNENADIIRLLLEKEGVDVNRKDNRYGQTPLSWASWNGHDKVVQLLLEKEGVDADSKDNRYGQTPLSWAAWNGHEKVVQLLLEKEGVDVDSKDNSDRTPLSWAAEKGHDKVVQLLLEKEEVDVDSKDNSDRTPLSWAAEKGHDKVVQLLLEKEEVDVDSKNKYGRTPLFWAAGNGHEKVVQLLLEKEGVDVNSKDKYGRTPLSRAAGNGHDKVVQLLLEKERVDVDSKDIEYGQTPLSWAAEKGHDKVVQLLLQEGVDVDSKSNSGRTPLSWAAEKGHDKVVQLLLEKEEVDVDSKSNSGRTPLSWAAEDGHDKVVQLLLEKEGVDVDSKSNSGRTPLSLAALNGYDKVVQLLLEKEGVDVDSKDNRYGRTPLSWAAEKGHDKVVQLLLEKEGVDVNSKDNDGLTPLSYARRHQRRQMVQILLGKGATGE